MAVIILTAKQKELLIDMRRQGMAYAGIAEALGLSVSTVKTFCWRHGSNVRKAHETDNDSRVNHKNKSAGTLLYSRCENCGKEIRQRAKMKPRRFCCAGCRDAWWNHHRALGKHAVNAKSRRKGHGVAQAACAYCGQPFSKYAISKQKYCSHPCYIAARFGVRTG